MIYPIMCRVGQKVSTTNPEVSSGGIPNFMVDNINLCVRLKSRRTHHISFRVHKKIFRVTQKLSALALKDLLSVC